MSKSPLELEAEKAPRESSPEAIDSPARESEVPPQSPEPNPRLAGARGPLPPVPQLPSLPPTGSTPAPPLLAPGVELRPMRGRLPTRDEIADHFISRTPTLTGRPTTIPPPLQPTASSLFPLSSDTARAHSVPPPLRAPESTRPAVGKPVTSKLNSAQRYTLVAGVLGGGVVLGALWARSQSDVELPSMQTLTLTGATAAQGVAAQPGRAGTSAPLLPPGDNAAAKPGSDRVSSPQPAASHAPTLQSPTQPASVAPGAADPLFAHRAQNNAVSCDTALGSPLQVHDKPSPGRSAALWSRSRRSVMAGRADWALQQMCEGASWDLAGRAAYGLVEYYFQASDFTQAQQWAERIPRSSSRYLDARGMIGDVHAQRGAVDTALKVYADTWNFELGDSARRATIAEGFLGGAVHALENGDSWTGERFARRAVLIDPTNSRAALTFARALGRFQLHDASLLWSARARELEK